MAKCRIDGNPVPPQTDEATLGDHIAETNREKVWESLTATQVEGVEVGESVKVTTDGRPTLRAGRKKYALPGGFFLIESSSLPSKATGDGVTLTGKMGHTAPAVLRWKLTPKVEDGKVSWLDEDGKVFERDFTHIAVTPNGDVWASKESTDVLEVALEAFSRGGELSLDELLSHEAVKSGVVRPFVASVEAALAGQSQTESSIDEVGRATTRALFEGGREEAEARAGALKRARERMKGKVFAIRPDSSSIEEWEDGTRSARVLGHTVDEGGNPNYGEAAVDLPPGFVVQIRQAKLDARDGNGAVVGKVVDVYDGSLPKKWRSQVLLGQFDGDGFSVLGEKAVAAPNAFVSGSRMWVSVPEADPILKKDEKTEDTEDSDDGGDGGPRVEKIVPGKGDEEIKKTHEDFNYVLANIFTRPQFAFRGMKHLVGDAIKSIRRAHWRLIARDSKFKDQVREVRGDLNTLSQVDTNRYEAIGKVLVHLDVHAEEGSQDAVSLLLVQYGGSISDAQLVLDYMKVLDTVRGSYSEHLKEMRGEFQKVLDKVVGYFAETDGDKHLLLRYARQKAEHLRAEARYRRHRRNYEQEREEARVDLPSWLLSLPEPKITEQKLQQLRQEADLAGVGVTRLRQDVRTIMNPALSKGGLKGEEALNAEAMFDRLVGLLAREDVTKFNTSHYTRAFTTDFRVMRILEPKDPSTGLKRRVQWVQPFEGLRGGFDTEEEATETIRKDYERLSGMSAGYNVTYTVKSKEMISSERDQPFLEASPALMSALQREIARVTTLSRKSLLEEISNGSVGVALPAEVIEAAANAAEAGGGEAAFNAANARIRAASLSRTLSSSLAREGDPGWSADPVEVLESFSQSVSRTIFRDSVQFHGEWPLQWHGSNLDTAKKDDKPFIRAWRRYIQDQLGVETTIETGLNNWRMKALKIKPGSRWEWMAKASVLRMAFFGVPTALMMASMGLGPWLPLLWTGARGALSGSLAFKKDSPLFSQHVAAADAHTEVIFKLLGPPWYLAYAAQNILQVFNVVGSVGPTAFFRGLKRFATRDISPELRDQFSESGLIAWETGEEIENRAIRQMTRMISVMAGWSEQSVRVVAMLGGLERAKELKLKRSEEISAEAEALRVAGDEQGADRLQAGAVDPGMSADAFAEAVVATTQYDYSPASKPGFLRYRLPIASSIVMFKNFLVQYVAMLFQPFQKTPNSPIWGTLKPTKAQRMLAFGSYVTASGVMTGVLASPVASLGFMAYMILSRALDDEDDDTPLLLAAGVKAIEEAQDSKAMEALFYGIPMILPFGGLSMAASVGQRELLPVPGGLNTLNTFQMRFADHMGPGFSTDLRVVENILTGKNFNEKLFGAISSISPSTGKTIQAVRGYRDGKQYTTTGKLLFEQESTAELIMQFAGMMPGEMSRAYERGEIQFIADKRRELDMARIRTDIGFAVESRNSARLNRAVRELQQIGREPHDPRRPVTDIGNYVQKAIENYLTRDITKRQKAQERIPALRPPRQ